MALYAVLEENSVVNVIIAESKEIAEELTEKVCKEYTVDNLAVQIGGTYDFVKNKFFPAKPYDSWILNEDSSIWEPPIPYPSDGEKNYEWDELEVIWKEKV
jgi:hypothetical protein